MSVPTAERPPRGLSAYWLGVWRHALKTLKAQGTWTWEQRPLLDEYVFALKAAEDARKGFKWLDKLELYAEEADELPDIAWSTLRQIAAGLPTQWDRHTKRAALLADQLLLTERSRKVHGLLDDTEDQKPKSKLEELDDFGGDNITPIRRKAAG